jgi:hypothetical protein
MIQPATNADMLVIHRIDVIDRYIFYSMIELLRSIYLQQVKRDEIVSSSSLAASMCQSIVQQLGNIT